MPKRISINLSEAQIAELSQVRNSHPKGYMREKAAAILKVASGELVSQVAERGLHKRHEPETVHSWLKAYQKDGVSGLVIRPGRGRKGSFFPSEPGSRL